LFKGGQNVKFYYWKGKYRFGTCPYGQVSYILEKPNPDSFARRAILDIDKAKVLNGFALENRYGYGMSSEQISTGTKTLLLIKNHPQFIYYASNMGDNCVPFLMELVKEREAAGMGDVTLLLEHFMDIPYE